MEKAYKKSRHGTIEEALMEMKKDADKKEKQERQRTRDEYIDEERAGKLSKIAVKSFGKFSVNMACNTWQSQ